MNEEILIGLIQRTKHQFETISTKDQVAFVEQANDDSDFIEWDMNSLILSNGEKVEASVIYTNRKWLISVYDNENGEERYEFRPHKKPIPESPFQKEG